MVVLRSALMPSEKKQVLRLRLSDYMKQLWQADDGTTFEKSYECQLYEDMLRLKKEEPLREKWFEQNDVEKLFDGLIPFDWALNEVGHGLKPQEKLFLEAKIHNHFDQSPEPLTLADIASRLGTSYEYVRRVCTEMFEMGLLSREKIENGKKGRPTFLYGPL